MSKTGAWALDHQEKEQEMKHFEITFKDMILAEDEDQAYQHFLDYLHEIVRVEDVTAFEFHDVSMLEDK